MEGWGLGPKTAERCRRAFVVLQTNKVIPNINKRSQCREKVSSRARLSNSPVSWTAESSLVNSQSGFGGAPESWEHWGLCWAKLLPDGVFSLPMPVNPLSCVPVFIKPPCSTMISLLPHGETDTRVDLCRCQNYCSHIWKPLALSLLDPPPDRL